jgi:Zn-dependent alcohol dehydrogenase
MGVEQIIVIDGMDDRLSLALDFGADHVIDLRSHATPDERVAQVKRLTGGWGADVVMELAGHARVVPEGLQMLGSGGTYLEIGTISQGPTCAIDPSWIVHGGQKVLGIMWYEADSLHKALRFLSKEQSRFPLNKILSHRYPLTAINEAFADQDAGKVHRAALLPW